VPRLRPEYPSTRTDDVVDDYHGVRVADPYRWLEDDHSADTGAWTGAQNALTRSQLDGLVRDALARRLTDLYDYPRVGVPVGRNGRYIFARNSGLQNQPVLFVQDGPQGAPRILLDPNALSADGTVALTVTAVNDTATLMAYGLSQRGSDRQRIAVRDVSSGRDLDDRLEWVKFATIAWTPEADGFYYTRFPEPGSVPAGDENYFNRVCFHRLGDPQERDALVYARPAERETVFSVDLSDDGRWVVITASRGASDKSEIYLLDRQDRDAAPSPLFTGFQSAYHFIQQARGRLYFTTDAGAPLGRIIAVHPESTAPPSEIVPESGDKLSAAVVAHDCLAVAYLHHASDRLHLFDLLGAPRGEIALPGIGSLTGLTGRPRDPELFFGFSAFTQPSSNYRYDVSTGALQVFARSRSPVDPAQYETTQVWYPSKDGTQVSMFLVHRRGLEPDGRRPVLLTGYGGFNISLTPAFDPANFVLLERYGIVAVANLRGGGEYGEAWHQAGTFERKQTVFDDFIAAAEWLIGSGYTCPAKLAIEGGSNGGLLTAAVMLQRPELFGAVICRVPVVDMLRYHRFTVGRFWIPEYGCADDPQQFPYLHRYSPYHTVRDGVAYPPILITTADTDDRVAPGMARKFAARLQAAQPGNADRPVLIRIDTRAGHGAGKPVSKMIEEDADIFAFLFDHLKLEDQFQATAELTRN
jgi:prolyl oligopeptidase